MVAALGSGVPADVLQLAGDGLQIAVEAQVPGAADLAASCAATLSGRGWAGDEELAQQLEVVIGRRAANPALKPLAVDLDELSMVLEAGLGEDGGVIDRQTGEVRNSAAIDYAGETSEDPPDFDDPDRWLFVGPEGSDDGYRDMADFIATVADPGRTERLGIAIDGRGAFGRFKDTLSRWPDDEDRWYRFSEERTRGRARRWLAEAGIRPLPGRGDLDP